MIIPAQIVSLVSLFAALAWLVYARSQSGRKQAKVLAWLALPFLAPAIIYYWFSIADVDIQVRAAYARFVIFGTSLSQAIILLVVAFMNRDTHAN